MTKKKLLISALVFCLIVPAMFVLTACGKKSTHSHVYSEEWSVDAEYHWHDCTDENCSATKDKAKHTFNDGGQCTVCQKYKFDFSINIGDDPIDLEETSTFQSYWLTCPDSEYLDINSYYGFEYYKYGEGATLTFVGSDFPTEAGSYQVKLLFGGDETYLPAQATADFVIG